jgi:hypothetical protein
MMCQAEDSTFARGKRKRFEQWIRGRDKVVTKKRPLISHVVCDLQKAARFILSPAIVCWSGIAKKRMPLTAEAGHRYSWIRRVQALIRGIRRTLYPRLLFDSRLSLRMREQDTSLCSIHPHLVYFEAGMMSVLLTLYHVT